MRLLNLDLLIEKMMLGIKLTKAEMKLAEKLAKIESEAHRPWYQFLRVTPFKNNTYGDTLTTSKIIRF